METFYKLLSIMFSALFVPLILVGFAARCAAFMLFVGWDYARHIEQEQEHEHD